MILAITVYVFIFIQSCLARPSFHHQVGYSLYENAYNGNGTMQAIRGPNGDGCADKSPLCVHMATAENCKSMDSVIRDCPRSCGKCKVECDSVEPRKRKDCKGLQSEVMCHRELCCWDGTEKSDEEGFSPKCFIPYFHPGNDENDRRTVVHM